MAVNADLNYVIICYKGDIFLKNMYTEIFSYNDAGSKCRWQGNNRLSLRLHSQCFRTHRTLAADRECSSHRKTLQEQTQQTAATVHHTLACEDVLTAFNIASHQKLSVHTESIKQALSTSCNKPRTNQLRAGDQTGDLTNQSIKIR